MTVYQVYVTSTARAVITEGFCVGECDTCAEAEAIRDEEELINADGISEGSLHVGIAQVAR